MDAEVCMNALQKGTPCCCRIGTAWPILAHMNAEALKIGMPKVNVGGITAPLVSFISYSESSANSIGSPSFSNAPGNSYFGENNG